MSEKEQQRKFVNEMYDKGFQPAEIVKAALEHEHEPPYLLSVWDYPELQSPVIIVEIGLVRAHNQANVEDEAIAPHDLQYFCPVEYISAEGLADLPTPTLAMGRCTAGSCASCGGEIVWDVKWVFVCENIVQVACCDLCYWNARLCGGVK